MRPPSAISELIPRGGAGAHARPFSAASRKSTISSTKQHHVSYKEKIDGLVRQGRGLGFFGDDNDRLRDAKEKKDMEGR